MSTPGVTRREFTMALAGSAAVAAGHQTIGQEQQPADAKPVSRESNNKAERSDGAARPPKSGTEPDREPPPEAAYILGLIMRRYPDERLDEAAASGIVRDIYGDLARSRTLSGFFLANSDEQAFVFEAWRGD